MFQSGCAEWEATIFFFFFKKEQCLTITRAYFFLFFLFFLPDHSHLWFNLVGWYSQLAADLFLPSPYLQLIVCGPFHEAA